MPKLPSNSRISEDDQLLEIACLLASGVLRLHTHSSTADTARRSAGEGSEKSAGDTLTSSAT